MRGLQTFLFFILLNNTAFSTMNWGAPEKIEQSIDGFWEFGYSAVDLDQQNGDDILVLLKSNPDVEAGIYWYQNKGDGTFHEKKLLHPVTNNFVVDVKAADIDLDGDMDLIHTRLVDIVFLENTGDLTFAEPVVLSSAPAADPYYALRLYDYDKNGTVDIFYFGHFQNPLNFMANLGQGNGFSDPITLFKDLSVVATNLSFGDIDHDGTDELFASSISDYLMLRNENELFESTQSYLIYDFLYGGRSFFGSMVVSNFDTDPDNELLIVNEELWQIQLYNYSEPNQFTLMSGIQVSTKPTRLVLDDFDLDGDSDAVFLTIEPRLSSDIGVRSLERLGESEFSESSELVWHYSQAYDLLKSDFDRDGDQDLVLISVFGGTSNNGDIFLLRNQVIPRDVTGDYWAFTQ